MFFLYSFLILTQDEHFLSLLFVGNSLSSCFSLWCVLSSFISLEKVDKLVICCSAKSSFKRFSVSHSPLFLVLEKTGLVYWWRHNTNEDNEWRQRRWRGYCQSDGEEDNNNYDNYIYDYTTWIKKRRTYLLIDKTDKNNNFSYFQDRHFERFSKNLSF